MIWVWILTPAEVAVGSKVGVLLLLLPAPGVAEIDCIRGTKPSFLDRGAITRMLS